VSTGALTPLWWSGQPAGAGRAALTREERVDVAIVGAGYTRLVVVYGQRSADGRLVFDAGLQLAKLADREERLTGRPALLGRALCALTGR